VQIIELGTAEVVARPSVETFTFDWSSVDSADLGDAITEAFADDLPALEADDLRMGYRLALEATTTAS